MPPELEGRILIVDDDTATCELLEAGLSRRGAGVMVCQRGADAIARASREDLDVVLTDLRLGDVDGIEVCRGVGEARPDVPVVVLTGHGTMDAAVAAMRAGAYDFVTKPVDLDHLTSVLRRAIERRQLRDEVRRLRTEVDDARGVDDMIGRSAAIRRVRDLVGRLARSDATVLITGESGTGKELVARALHRRSRSSSGPFLPVNCAALPENLLESELFGHVKGAFTDARRSRAGLFVEASGGTLFLDEVGEMPAGMQAKLLRALQERRVRPVGGADSVSFDARILAATNRDLEAEVKAGRFREDLYYRIHVVEVAVPPLRARGNDVLLLAQHFVEQVARRLERPVTRLSSEAAHKLVAYEWPGNVRELQNTIERAVTLARLSEIVVADLPDKVRDYRSGRVVIDTDDPDELLPLTTLERRYITRVLRATSGNKTRAAQILGIDRRTLYRKLERFARDDGPDFT